jgi:CRP/FNR family nitrogen fixation transcriptional regulator
MSRGKRDRYRWDHRVQTETEPMSLAAPLQQTVAPRRESFAPEPIDFIGAVAAYGRDQEIFGQGEPARQVYKVRSGAVRCFKLLSDGRRQISDFYLPGDVFGVEAGAEHRVTAEALTDTVLTVARRAALTEGEDQIGRAQALWRLAVADLQRSQDHALTLGRRSATERVASFLVDIANRLGNARNVVLPMTRQDMADYLGLTIETVSRTLSHLQCAGVIRIGSCRAIELLDRESLLNLCE